MDSDQLVQLAAVAKDAALLHGVLMRTEETPNSSESVTFAPFTLFPTPVPKAAFQQALEVQSLYNTLVDRISQDSAFLQDALASTVTVDDFTARLFRIHQTVLKEGKTQWVVLGLNRSDYMLDHDSSLKQIEINTIAASFAGLASHMADVHRLVLSVANRKEQAKQVLDNDPAAGLARGISTAWDLYGEPRAVVMFLVEESQRNIFDQRVVENELWRRNIRTIRKRFDDVTRSGFLDEEKRLFVEDQEVAVVYFRNGYMPQNYVCEKAWEARLLLERSLAVKCPDISTHLAGTKKVQQVLSRPGVLERFFPDQPQAVQKIRDTFAGLYTLDQGEEGDRTVAMALANPERFVLKPQREGGGNNLYGSEMCEVLEAARGNRDRTAFILMDKVQPTPNHNYLLRKDTPLALSHTLSELGVFGCYVRRGSHMLINECVGHLLRTKSSQHLDGGVAAGVAVLDTPLIS